ncbi:MAG TPA: hypothetical protein VNR40_22240 [Steroidobacter sp.]|nr:hypothetical protein [Steroidobacter sp.]
MNADEKSLGERMKATAVAIRHFQARHPPTVSDPDSMRRLAEDLQAYPIASKRHLQQMRSELDATARQLRRHVSRGYWPRHTYDLLVAHLRGEGLIDISTWTDTDAERMKQILEAGEIRTAAQWRLATEYRDTVDDEKLRRQIDGLIDSYEAGRPTRREKSAGAGSKSKTAGSGSKLSSDELALIDLLRRSAVASYEYAAARPETSAKDKPILEGRAETWRTIEITTKRDLKDMEDAFWASLLKLRKRLTEAQFQQLATRLQDQGLIDISSRVKASTRRSKRA